MFKRYFIRGGLIFLGLLFVGSVLVGCQANPATGKNNLILISESAQLAIGERCAADFEKTFQGRHPEASLQDYLQQIGGKLAGVSDRVLAYQFVLLKSDVPNAFVLPGGKVYLTAGMIRALENEAQLAALLAHEIGHAAARHSVLALQRQIGALDFMHLAEKLAEDPPSEPAVARMANHLAALRYSYQDEVEADRWVSNT